MLLRKRHQLIYLIYLMLAVVALVGWQPIHGQTPFTIKILEPADGAIITGALTIRGEATVPPEKQLTLQITALQSGTVLATMPLPVTGEPGTVGTFSISGNFNVGGDTPILVVIAYSFNGNVVAAAQVHATLRPGNPPQAAPQGVSLIGDLAAVRLALEDYEGRVQVVTPMPVSIEDRVFNDQCLGLPRTAELCIQGQLEGKVVKLTYGGMPFTYHVGNNQARLNTNESAQIGLKASNSIPKVLADAMAATGVKLYLPQRLTGPFQNLPLAHVDWDSGIVTLTYSSDKSGVSFTVSETRRTPDMVFQTTGTDLINTGSISVAAQSANGRKVLQWPIEGTVITVSVPDTTSSVALADLATGFAVLGSIDPGQTNPYNRVGFDRLTLALPEPVKSTEMARQALMSLIRPARKGNVISIQQRNFADSCMQLARKDEQDCVAAATPGYVIGVADTELFRYHVAGNAVRLNRDNSDLNDKFAGDYASVDAVKAAASGAGFGVIVPNDPNVKFLSAQMGQATGGPYVLLIFRDGKTNGVFSLRETMTTTAAQSNPVKNPDGATLDVLTAGPQGDKMTLVSLWASPEIGDQDLVRIRSALG